MKRRWHKRSPFLFDLKTKHIIFVSMKYLITLILSILSINPAVAQDVPQSEVQMKLSFSPIVKTVAPSVVNIYAKRVVQNRQSFSPFLNDPFFNQFFGRGFGGMQKERIENSLGSGVILEQNGFVMTNAHVVDNAQEAVVALNDGREFDAQIVLVDKASDLAVLKIDGSGTRLPTAKLAPSETLEVGDLVLAIGNPFGVGQTVTSGIVSALARSTMNINDFNFFIQTDAAINPGNSGGPLVDMDGNVVGINTAIYSRDGGSLGIGFSVPSEMVQTVMNAARSQYDPSQTNNTFAGKIKRPWIGLNAQMITSDIANSLNLENTQGALVTKLHPQSPLLREGIKVGDIITHIDGRRIKDPAEMRFRLATTALNERVKMTYKREGREKIAEIRMIEAPDLPDRQKTQIKGQNIFQGIGLCVINPALQEEMSLNIPDEGVVVCGMGERNYARRFLREGDVIVRMNGREIEKPSDVQYVADRIDSRGLELILIRNGRQQILNLR